jgi:hypothetical protein
MAQASNRLHRLAGTGRRTFVRYLMGAVACFASYALHAETAAQARQVLTIQNVCVTSVNCVSPVNRKIDACTAAPDQVARLNSAIDVYVNSLEDAIIKDHRDPKKFTMYLNGYPLTGLKPSLQGKDCLRFILARTDDNKAAWAQLLGSPSRQRIPMTVELRADDQSIVPIPVPTPATLHTDIVFEVFAGWVAILWGVVLAALLMLFVYLAITTNILRDTIPPQPPAGKRRPYSLARFQMAWWFLVVICSFIFIFALTNDWGTINDEALILMGIGTGTALGAAIIEITKQNGASSSTLEDLIVQQAKANAAIAAQNTVVQDLVAKQSTPPTAQELQAIADANAVLAEKKKELATVTAAMSSPVSENFISDLLTDAGGANVHRFQMFGWTIVLGLVYVFGVYKTLALPDFSATLNALLGISSGAYLGFKIPEKQT